MTKNTHFVRRYIENATISETFKPLLTSNAKMVINITMAVIASFDPTQLKKYCIFF